YAMRFIEGESLREAIRHFHDAERPGRDPGERSLALRQLLGRFTTVCNTVAYAHSKGVLHRDLKPANIMLGRYGETLVVDWGLARALRDPEGAVPAQTDAFPPSALRTAAEAETRLGDVVGTLAYMSPEEARGRRAAAGAHRDVFSLGATLDELLTGRAPFEGTAGELLEQARRGDVLPPRRRNPAVPPSLEAVVGRAMARDPRQRYATAQDLAADLE